jgi:chemosensory pili system protein ChpA (sensor histidine kinase/response regulator)
MTDINSQTLHVVAKELTKTLVDARVSLEEYSERIDQLVLLEKCAEQLHLAHGALRLVEVYGAALLAEEMEHVTRYLIDTGREEARRDEKRLYEGLDALMRAMVQLPTYLERVLSGGRDLALVLLPLLNDLRSVRGGALLSEGTLLLLNLKSDQPPQPAPAEESPIAVAHWARRLRSRFQIGLLGLIRGERAEQCLEVMAKVATKLEQVATTQPVFQFWWVTGAIIDALRTNGLEPSPTLKRLLGQADRQIKALYEQGELRYCENPPVDLLNNMLYYVARASTQGGRVAAVRASFKLSELLPLDESIEQERESLSAPSVKLMRTVAAAIKEDLGKVKDVLDIFARRGGGKFSELSPQVDLLRKISETLGVLGLGELRERVQRETADLTALLGSNEAPPQEALLKVAGVLLSVEDSLDDQLVRLILPNASGDAHSVPADAVDLDFRLVSEAVLRECIVNLARIKDAISTAVQRPGEFSPQGLDNVPPLLRGITAGLLMLGKTRAVESMEAIGVHVRHLVEPGSPPPDSQRLERVADAIVSLEYYMETIQSGRSDPWYMLDNAEICIRALDAELTSRLPKVAFAGGDVGATDRLDSGSAPTVADATQIGAATTLMAPDGPPQGRDAPPPAELSPPPPVVAPDVDPHLVELFIEEAKEEMHSIGECYPLWEQNPMDGESLVKLRRSFHTLKGSGRMVGARLMGDYAWSIENLANRVLDKTLSRTPGMMSVMRTAIAALPHLIEQLETGRPAPVPVEDIIARAHAYAYADGRDPEEPYQATVVLTPTATKSPVAMAQPAAVAEPTPPEEPTAPVEPVAHAESVAATEPTTAPDAQATGPLAVAVAVAPEYTADSEPVPAPAPLEEAIPDEAGPSSSMDPLLHDIYSKETTHHLTVIRDYLARRRGQLPPHDLPEAVYRAIHTLSGSSKMAEARHGIRVTEPLDHYMRRVFDAGLGLSDRGLALLADSVAAIENVVSHIDESTIFFAEQPKLIERMRMLEADLDERITSADPAGSAEAADGTERRGDAPARDLAFDQEIANIYSEEATELLEAAQVSLNAWNGDRKAQEPVAELQRQLHTLKGGARMAGISAMGDLSHELETLVIQIDSGAVFGSDVAHTVLQNSLDELARMRDAVSNNVLPAPASALMAQIRALNSGQTIPVTAAAAAAQSAGGAYPLVAVAARTSVPLVAKVAGPAAAASPPSLTLVPPVAAPTPPDPGPAAVETPIVPVLPGREAVPVERAEMARVDADLLDVMLNSAGEVSIFRARLGQQVNSIDFNLVELARTVTRLKEQLRGLQMETEAQVLNRHRDLDSRRTDFDPLELDRYSSLQQFSRALVETSSDVASIQGLLETLTREAQNLLTQQSRVITDLQNSLLRTRMVPFHRHVQRLTRLVRQTANDTGKRAELVVQGADAELDRQVLERMIPPLEHMLRNAVVHGIESPERRTAAGKPDGGRITVSLEREGAEVAIVVADDGAGINVKLIREKAISLGLADPHARLSDEEAMQLILEPGFSTAGLVTQAAGRGVGMDVVATEVKKLGGGLFIESVPGQGSRFTVRLPFTLAISQALIVRVAEEVYALPMPTVEGVVRLPRNIVVRHLGKDAPLFEYGGQKYRFQQLGAFVGLGATPLPDADVSMSVVLIRAGEYSTALITDELIGSREIVVKNLGPQISAIRGIAGATILGDGRIVVILDMGSLVRSEWRTRATELPVLEHRDRRRFALVVDDSITVRRVTQRLLERNGMRVLTAKDGVEAISLLQDNVPDIILLDIEMPRMDGYEVAAHVRNDARLRDIPIVMITSRVSEKHRARAIELGVDDYLGKPYQESQLLDAIEPLLERRSALAR